MMSSSSWGSLNTKVAACHGVLRIAAIDVYPVKTGESQRFSSPRRQYKQVPSTPPHPGDTDARAKRHSGVAPSSTTPTIWWPGLMGASRRQFAFDDV